MIQSSATGTVSRHRRLTARPRRPVWSGLTVAAILATGVFGTAASASTNTHSSAIAAVPQEQVAHTASCTPITRFRVVYVSPLTANYWWALSARLMQQWAVHNCASVQVVGPADEVDIPTILTDIQQAINEHPDMIVTCACAGGFDHVLRQAKNAGIIVETIAADTASPASRNIFFGTGYAALGEGAAKAFIQKTGGHATIGVLMEDGTTTNQVAELAAFKSTIKSTPGISIAEVQFDNSDATTAQSEITTMLTTHPDINGIWCLEGTCGSVIESSLKQLNDPPGKINALGIDLLPPTVQGIQQGYIWASLYQQEFVATPLMGKCGEALKAGQTVPTDVDTGFKLITKANLPKTLPPPLPTWPDIC